MIIAALNLFVLTFGTYSFQFYSSGKQLAVGCIADVIVMASSIFCIVQSTQSEPGHRARALDWATPIQKALILSAPSAVGVAMYVWASLVM